MCGIVGYVGRRDCAQILLEGLQQLEYRGYDSAGIAVAKSGALRVHKRQGKVRELAASLPKRFGGTIGVGHTRWATHGEPSDRNAHPHTDHSGRIAVVHNGMLENAAALLEDLRRRGIEPVSETDTELLAHLIAAALQDGASTLEEAVRTVLARVYGAYGIAVIDAESPQAVVVARNGSPVVLGIGEREMFVASDVAALVRHTQQVVYLDDGEIAVVAADGYSTSTLEAVPTTKEALELDWDASDFERGASAHFMHKEIHEQPESIAGTLRGRLEKRFATAHLGGLNLSAPELRAIRRVHVLGCGSAYYAGLVGAELIESLARIPARAEPASEFRYRNPLIEPDTLYLAVSQSGETFDTLAAVQEVRRKGGRVLGVVNVVGSTIARDCDGGIYIHAGPEVAVASTKAFTCTAVAFALLALHLGRMRDLGPSDGERMLEGLAALPGQVEELLGREEEILPVAARCAQAASMFFVGRGRCYPIALEGAQKLKEISYVHAEAYPTSELKHGPLALIAPEVPTVALLPNDELLAKNLSSVEQIRARSGPVIALGHGGLEGDFEHVLTVPKNEPELDPILLNIPLQLLAYHAAIALGRDIDQPRNLAKSVTVE